jgi:hypothetical protein
MSFNKKFFTTGGIVASTPSAAAFDPLQNFETVTYTGNGSTQKITGHIRKGAAFNGSSSKIEISPSPQDNAGVMSVSFWTKTTSTSRATFFIAEAPNPNKEFLRLENYGYQGTNSLRVTYDNSFLANIDNEAISDGNWHHIVVTAGSGNVKTYKDGTLLATQSVTIADRTLDAFAIGYRKYNNDLYFNGGIDQVRIFNRVLLEDNNGVNEIQALADETYADPKKSTTDYFGDGHGVALYELDEDANGTVPSESLVETNQLINLRAENYTSGSTWTDISGQNNNATLTNPTKPTTESVHFDYANLGAQNQYGGNNVSIEFFIKTINTDDDYFLTAFNGGGFIPGEMVLYIPNSAASGKPYLRVTGSTSSVSQLAFNHTVVQGEWTHYVLVYDSSLTGNTNRFIMYVNGVEVTTSVIGGVDSFDNSNFMGDTSTLFIGKRGDGTDYEEMDIKEFRIYSKSLSSQEVAQNYAASAFKYNGTPTSVNFLGMAFQPDLVWIKNRNSTQSHRLYDSVRGANLQISSNQTAAESNSGGLTSFDSNGFSLDNWASVNTNNNTYVAWCWKAGGSVTPNNNTNGTIPSTVSANPDAGFSIVKYTGNNTAGATVGHGLSSVPQMIIVKRLSLPIDNWAVYNETIGNTKRLALDENAATAGPRLEWNSTTPTNTVFTLGNHSAVNQTSGYIAYCFHSVDGYQKVGYFNQLSGTTTVSTGFEPRFLIIKRTDSTGDWIIFDNLRNNGDAALYANSSIQEQDTTGYTMAFNNDGFVLTVAAGSYDVDYIYLAIA